MKSRCRQCNREFIHKGYNVAYCSSECSREYIKIKEKKKKANNPWLVYWKYKTPSMILRTEAIIDNTTEYEIFTVCDYHFKNDRFINNKQTQ